MKARDLTDLEGLKKTLAAQKAAQIAALEAARLKALQAEQTRHEFTLTLQKTLGKIAPLKNPQTRVNTQSPPPKPEPQQRQADEAAALQASWSDAFDVSTLLETDEALSYRQPHLGADVLTRLRRGDWAIQGQLDLHGLRSDEAREALAYFLHSAQVKGLRCVRVVHGKGLGSVGKTPVLKGKVLRWLVQKAEVLAFVQAPPAQGGAGALVVLLS